MKSSRHLVKQMLAVAFSALTIAQPLQAVACTSFLLKTDDQGYVYGRTMEFALPLHSQLAVIPRNLAIKATGPDGTAGSGLHYTTKYAAIGANGLGLPVLVDGVNEKGLAGGLLFFPGFAEFENVDKSKGKNSIASYELLTYLLTNFATVAEVKAGLPKIKVNRAPQEVFKMPVPIHATVHDATGKSLVIEYVGGALEMTDNPTGVMTNAPAIDWHFGNLGQYVNATAAPVGPWTINGKSFAPVSSGAGMNGLPGDMTSPARFVRAAFYVANAPAIATTTEGLNLAFHYLNLFDIPAGAVRTSAAAAAGGGVSGYETTEWSAAADLKNKVYQIRTFANPQARQLSMEALDLDAKTVRFIPIDQAPAALDLSK